MNSQTQKKARFSWRRWNTILHRDVGYLCAALTLVYAISGVAVNHTDSWNPNIRIEHVTKRFEPLPGAPKEQVVEHLRSALELPEPTETFRSSPNKIQLFYDGWNVEAELQTGTAVIERPHDRVLLRDLNFLHLNHPKGLWTYFADLYAVALAFLAISGLMILRGKQGFGGRGKWLFAIGLAIPIVFVLLLRYL